MLFYGDAWEWVWLGPVFKRHHRLTLAAHAAATADADSAARCGYTLNPQQKV